MAKKRTPRTTAKTTAVVVASVPAKIEQEHGGFLNAGGTIGNRGGRPRDDIRLICEDALRDCKGIDVVKAIASGDILEILGTDQEGRPIIGNTKNKDRLTAVSLMLDRAYGKAPQEIKVSGNSAGSDESGEAVMQRLLAMIGRALLAAPAAQRLAVIHEIERAEGKP